MSESKKDDKTSKTPVEAALKLRFLSHGTLECTDLAFTRRFYEEFLGFEVVKVSNISLWCRLGGQHIYVVVLVKPDKKTPMSFLNHNGIDVETEEEVDECHRIVLRDAEKWRLHTISKPSVQHGTYSFFFRDADDNCWEILANPEGGYTWMFERGEQEGIGHMSRSFPRPPSTLRKRPKDGPKES
jgi:catechol 2,3-dioxygenase-like lactoylglutathione lyase family enzyme